MEKELNILITGKIANGKTTVAEIIAKTLKENGFDVTYTNTEDKEMTDERKSQRLAALASITKINIQEVAVKSEPILN